MANRRPDRLARRSFFLSPPSPSSHRRLAASPLPHLARAASRHASPRTRVIPTDKIVCQQLRSWGCRPAQADPPGYLIT